MGRRSCEHQYCPADHCIEEERIRACRHLSCPAHRCLKVALDITTVYDLKLPARVRNLLIRENIDVTDLLAMTPNGIHLIRGCGKRYLLCILRALGEVGYKLQPGNLQTLHVWLKLSPSEVEIVRRVTE